MTQSTYKPEDMPRMIYKDSKGRVPNYVKVGEHLVHQPTGISVPWVEGNFRGTLQKLVKKIQDEVHEQGMQPEGEL
ncbi:hypothetical protein MAINES_00040 [Brevundimonas phage vB_BpoS-MaInes]|nr:hypothetical protein MAINES_00040 [Brevundimonas phage vB_BpoS-MaInes]